MGVEMPSNFFGVLFEYKTVLLMSYCLCICYFHSQMCHFGGHTILLTRMAKVGNSGNVKLFGRVWITKYTANTVLFGYICVPFLDVTLLNIMLTHLVPQRLALRLVHMLLEELNGNEKVCSKQNENSFFFVHVQMCSFK